MASRTGDGLAKQGGFQVRPSLGKSDWEARFNAQQTAITQSQKQGELAYYKTLLRHGQPIPLTSSSYDPDERLREKRKEAFEFPYNHSSRTEWQEHDVNTIIHNPWPKSTTKLEADKVMRSDPRYIERTVRTHMQASPGGDLRDLYKPGMTKLEADRVMRSDPQASPGATKMQIR